jgi:putative transposase
MSWVRVYIHYVFCTKNRYPFLSSREIRSQVFNHIKENAKVKDIWLDCVNGYHDHSHCLVSLGVNQNISKIAQLIKGESSHWINKNKITPLKFMWQDDYWAVSVSESHLERVRKYIFNQEERHRNKGFNEEVEIFMEKYGWKLIKDDPM